MNLSKDLTTGILVVRRKATIDPTEYNAIATQAGLPTISSAISPEEMDQAMYLHALPDYGQGLTLLDQEALLRQVIMFQSFQLQQGYRANQLAEQRVLLDAALLAKMVEPSLQANSGRLN